MEILGVIVLVVAVVATGLLAGLFYGFTVAVMPGLARASGRTFVETMQRINVAILRPSFFLTFLGAPALALIAVLLHFGEAQRVALPWLIAGLAANIATLAITAAVNVPLNNALDSAGPPDQSTDVDSVRHGFERRWVRWNTIRTATSVLGFVLLVVALLVRP